LNDKKLLEYGSKLIEYITPYFLKGGPRLPVEQMGKMGFLFGDFIEETNFRGLDLKEMKQHLDAIRLPFNDVSTE
jgi:hypothetical protein